VNDATQTSCEASTVPLPCHAGRVPVPILETHGSLDSVVPYNGGGARNECLPTVAHFMQQMAAANGLGTANLTNVLYGGDVELYQWGGNGSLKGTIEHYWVSGLGHVWP
jgi:poly(3-hydroxybutyrate) depolymerase